MNTNALVNQTLLVKAEEARRKNEKLVYLELWDVLTELLERPYAELTQEEIIHMDRVARLLHDYEDRLYPAPSK
ncbi:hypothetical protein [Spirosoma endbachense]|uniref:Uncharacterized protein n=1 Tax=Spirosoma endbachense TaxID=2666025 RepID=A0A6P1W488_9BACT|nr:hypothetical protein [Spirosoma endbachense]QHV98817.1 hypothetical protein GJR95_29115 [Spirosoma endbachense]